MENKTVLRIKVTKEILRKTKYCGTYLAETNKPTNQSCAIAEAVISIFPNASVGNVVLCFDSRSHSSPLPENARVFIREFDTTSPDFREELPEFEFEIEVPESVINSVNIDEVKELLKGHKTLELINQ